MIHETFAVKKFHVDFQSGRDDPNPSFFLTESGFATLTAGEIVRTRETSLFG